MISKIIGKNCNTPTKHLIHNNVKITDKKDIANHLAEIFSQNSSSKNQSKNRKSKSNFKTKLLKASTNFSITELKESLNKAHNSTVGTDKIHYQFPEELPETSKNYLLQIFNNMGQQ